FGEAPAGCERLILGHESLGRVLEAPAGSGLQRGDLVAGIVRRPDPVPCPACGAGEWDMCSNGRYTERGIKARHGYGSERWRVEPAFAVRIDPALEPTGMLLEPASVVAKAWEHIERIGARAYWRPKRVLVTGAGPIGLLAAMLGAQRGLEVHVLDQVSEGPKPVLVDALGATYHSGGAAEVAALSDVIIECTGASSVVLDVLSHSARDGIVCLTGVSSGGRAIPVDAAQLGRGLVLENDVVFGAVNANRRHWQAAGEALGRADRTWLQALITRREPMERWEAALGREPNDVKVVLGFES
ncbi:MAG: alcohol dehydrogenase catalytic domain-containing protein, partial [Actinomycetota bacterium]|nr:alcohol dehydrogenase catalytic domain-containing protein [Actinomycetota bacterium]